MTAHQEHLSARPTPADPRPGTPCVAGDGAARSERAPCEGAARPSTPSGAGATGKGLPGGRERSTCQAGRPEPAAMRLRYSRLQRTETSAGISARSAIAPGQGRKPCRPSASVSDTGPVSGSAAAALPIRPRSSTHTVPAFVPESNPSNPNPIPTTSSCRLNGVPLSASHATRSKSSHWISTNAQPSALSVGVSW